MPVAPEPVGFVAPAPVDRPAKPNPVRRFAVAIGALTGPNVIGAALSLASTPILVTWFSPAQFGTTASALAQASIISGLVTLKLETVLYRPELAAWRLAIARLGLLVTVVVASLLFFPLLPLDGLLRHSFGAATLVHALLVYALTAAICVANIGTAFLISEQRYLRSGIPKIVTPAVMLIVAAAAHFGHLAGEVAFLAANVAGLAVAALMYARALLRGPARPLEGGARTFLRSQKTYFAAAVPQSIVGQASFLNLFIMIVASCYGAASAGQLFLAYRIVGFPSTVLGVAASNLIAADVDQVRGRGMRVYMARMAVFGLLIYLPLLVASFMVPSGLIPPRWRSSLAVTAPVILLCFAQFAIGSFGQLLLVWNRAGVYLVWDTVRLIATSGVGLLCWVLGGSAVLAAWLFVGVHLVAYGVLAAIMIAVAHRPTPARPELAA